MPRVTQGLDHIAAAPARGHNPLRGLVFVTHPFPALMNGLAGAVFYCIGKGSVPLLGTAAIFLSILFTHAAIGSMNDYLDIDLDRRTKPAKPLVRGDIAPATALIFSCVAAVIGLGLSLTFGLWPFLVALMVLAAGMVYDFWAKDSLWSWVPYGISIPALPVWSFLAAGAFTPVLLASFPFGVLLSLALNLANTLPDIAGDTAYGLQGLAHRLGRQGSLLVTWGCFAVTLAMLTLSPWLFASDRRILLSGVTLGTLLLLAMVVDETLNRSTNSLKRGWYLSALTAGVIGIAWVASLPRG